jgi:hypothetical protein
MERNIKYVLCKCFRQVGEIAEKGLVFCNEAPVIIFDKIEGEGFGVKQTTYNDYNGVWTPSF